VTFIEGFLVLDYSVLCVFVIQVGLFEVEVDVVLISDRYSDVVRVDEV